MASRQSKLVSASNTDRGLGVVEVIDDLLSDFKDNYDELCELAGLEPLDDLHEALNEYHKVNKGDADE